MVYFFIWIEAIYPSRFPGKSDTRFVTSVSEVRNREGGAFAKYATE